MHLRLLTRKWINFGPRLQVSSRPFSAAPRDAAAGRAVFAIANTGPCIPPKRQAQLFQRFFRLAADRDRASGGAGLGLSLCREIALAHGGEIALTRGEPDHTEFTVTLPLGP